MKKHGNILLILIGVLAMLIVGILYAYNKYYLPSSKAYSTYLEIYQEYDSNEINSFTINSINHKVVIKSSSTDKIKIDYYQKAENSNTYSIQNGKLTLNIIEKVEDIDNILFKAEKAINVITIYLPENIKYNFAYETINGSASIEGATFSKIELSTITGDLKIRNINAQYLYASTNTGSIGVDESEVIKSDLSNVTGSIQYSILSSINDYNCNITTNYGNLLWNGEKLYEVTEDGKEIQKKELINDIKGASHSLNIYTIRGQISFETNEISDNLEEQGVEE